jgi:hypothetical protein
MKILEKGAEMRYWEILREGETLSMEETAQAFQDYINRHDISDLLTF